MGPLFFTTTNGSAQGWPFRDAWGTLEAMSNVRVMLAVLAVVIAAGIGAVFALANGSSGNPSDRAGGTPVQGSGTEQPQQIDTSKAGGG